MKHYQIRSLSELSVLRNDRVRHVHSLGPKTVVLPPLTIGATFFANMKLRELPLEDVWQATSYESSAPALFVVQDALVCSSPGIVAIDGVDGNFVCRESLIHTDPKWHGYETRGNSILLGLARIELIDAPALSLLAGATENLFHFIIDSIGRLGAIRDDYLRAAQTLLVPAPSCERYAELLRRIPVQPTIRIRPVHDGEVLRVRTLIQPSTICGDLKYHPCLTSVTRTLTRPGKFDLPRRFYVDRRHSHARPLINEGDVVVALQRLGISSVVLETWPLEQQIALFAEAEFVVAPHGAGLTHCAYAPPGCRVLELLMDSYLQYGYRTLAAVCGLTYDCVVGKSIMPWHVREVLDPHSTPWKVSVPHVIAAASHMA